MFMQKIFGREDPRLRAGRSASSGGKIRAFGRVLSLFLALGLVIGALSLLGCDLDDDDDFVDDHQLNSRLVGNWKLHYEGSYESGGETIEYSGDEEYKIDAIAKTITLNDTGSFSSFTGSIEYVYNFSETAGVLIIKYTENTDDTKKNKYSAVYFRNLTATTVKLGAPYDASDTSAPVEVDSLAAAKEKFKPANISLYGGELTMASPQTKQ
jgi:hypothetical protein